MPGDGREPRHRRRRCARPWCCGAQVARALSQRPQRKPKALPPTSKQRGGKALLLAGGHRAAAAPSERLLDETVGGFGPPRHPRSTMPATRSRAARIAETTGRPVRRADRHQRPPVFVACRGGVRQFRKQGAGGVIINVSSVAARTGGGGGSLICMPARRRFIATFSSALAKEVAAEGIRVNVVSPGVIATDCRIASHRPEQLRSTALQIPHARIGTPDECVGAFLYLCSRRSSAVTSPAR